LRERLGQEARDYAQEWAAERMAKRMAEFYRHVCERRPLAAVCPVRAAASAASD
jgi:hypothetical protein